MANPLDPEASWAKKGGRRYFGYKAHVGVDLGSNIIRVAHLTTAAVADTTAADALRARGAKDRISHRPNKYHPLTPSITR